MRSAALLAALAFAGIPRASAGWFVDGETGMAWSGYNDVRIPGDGGTEFSLTEDLETDPGLYARLRFGRTFGRHEVSLFAAPLRLEAHGAADSDILFNGSLFPAGTELDADYRFDSYRLTYRYALVERDGFGLSLGLTAKIRDAAVGVSGGGTETVKTNTGFVPLVSFGLDWRASGPIHAIIDGDALVGPVGRAEDVFLGLGWVFDPTGRLSIGWRFVEGGADVDESYNFTMINFAALGYRLNL